MAANWFEGNRFRKAFWTLLKWCAEFWGRHSVALLVLLLGIACLAFELPQYWYSENSSEGIVAVFGAILAVVSILASGYFFLYPSLQRLFGSYALKVLVRQKGVQQYLYFLASIFVLNSFFLLFVGMDHYLDGRATLALGTLIYLNLAIVAMTVIVGRETFIYVESKQYVWDLFNKMTLTEIAEYGRFMSRGGTDNSPTIFDIEWNPIAVVMRSLQVSFEDRNLQVLDLVLQNLMQFLERSVIKKELDIWTLRDALQGAIVLMREAIGLSRAHGLPSARVEVMRTVLRIHQMMAREKLGWAHKIELDDFFEESVKEGVRANDLETLEFSLFAVQAICKSYLEINAPRFEDIWMFNHDQKIDPKADKSSDWDGMTSDYFRMLFSFAVVAKEFNATEILGKVCDSFYFLTNGIHYLDLDIRLKKQLVFSIDFNWQSALGLAVDTKRKNSIGLFHVSSSLFFRVEDPEQEYWLVLLTGNCTRAMQLHKAGMLDSFRLRDLGTVARVLSRQINRHSFALVTLVLDVLTKMYWMDQATSEFKAAVRTEIDLIKTTLLENNLPQDVLVALDRLYRRIRPYPKPIGIKFENLESLPTPDSFKQQGASQ